MSPCADGLDTSPPCAGDGFVTGCTSDTPTTVGIDLAVAFALVYFLIICAILLYKLRALNSLPYDKCQGEIVFYRLQVRCTAALGFHPIYGCHWPVPVCTALPCQAAVNVPIKASCAGVSALYCYWLAAFPQHLACCSFAIPVMAVFCILAVEAACLGDDLLHGMLGAAVSGAPRQLCQLPILLAGPYAHAGQPPPHLSLCTRPMHL